MGKGTFYLFNDEDGTCGYGSGFLFKIWIGIQQLSEYRYGSNMDPDPQPCFFTAFYSLMPDYY